VPIQVLVDPADYAEADAAPRQERELAVDVDKIVTLYREAGRALRSGDPSGWAAHLTMPQVRVLYFLGRQGQASVGEVAAEMGVTQPSATEMLEKLVRGGLVERTTDACDRRKVRNALTPAGRELIDLPWEARRSALASALQSASREEREEIARGLTLLCDVLQRSGQTVHFATEARQNGPGCSPARGGATSSAQTNGHAMNTHTTVGDPDSTGVAAGGKPSVALESGSK
jgi:DNA-binding MarR family transcriptional regulator